jgi:threonine/homoserine/homoserine lactone efflux protein
MEFTELFIKGIVIGLVIAAPVGPIGFLCISRTLEYGAAIGLATGLGAATADAVYGAVVAFGLMQVAVTLSEQDTVLRIVGGLALCLIGMRSLFLADRRQQEFAAKEAGSKPARTFAKLQAGRGFTGSFGSSFILTLANPATILGFLAFFAAVGWARDLENHAGATVLVVGVFLGSGIWWLGLAAATALLSSRMGDQQRVWIQRLSGMVILGFGVFALLSALA